MDEQAIGISYMQSCQSLNHSFFSIFPASTRFADMLWERYCDAISCGVKRRRRRGKKIKTSRSKADEKHEALPDVIMCKSVLYRSDFNIFDISSPFEASQIMKYNRIAICYVSLSKSAVLHGSMFHVPSSWHGVKRARASDFNSSRGIMHGQGQVECVTRRRVIKFS